MSSKSLIESPLIISGPCSAESEEQLLKTAQKLKQINVDIFRAGVWKPRTRPNGFEGIGVPALEWLKNVKIETGFKVITEIANPYHLEKVLENKIDFVWIGARTTGNPFAVQEIANAARGTNIPIFVKNPLIPEINLWIGAIERLKNAGLKNIFAIHRGFYSAISSMYRNIPHWNIPIELKSLMPEVPIICDPSHISGKKEFVRDISKKAFEYNLDGLMIETHIDPTKAKTDQYQQIKPSDLELILKDINKNKRNLIEK